MRNLRGLLFDKDGTLFDFQATWGGWAADFLFDLARGDPEAADFLADLVRLDRRARRFHPDSVVIAGTTDDVVAALLPGLPELTACQLAARLSLSASALTPSEAAPLAPLLTRLISAGYILGVATNDDEAVALAQLERLGVRGYFEFVAGADSGFGAKPTPGQCHAFAAATGLAPERVAMIGDSTHDLHAGRAAGMVPVAVLTGTASHEDLSPFAAVVLPDIGHLPDWLELG